MSRAGRSSRPATCWSQAGSTSHCVNGGGDLICVGSAAGRPWRLGVVDPRDSGQLLATVAGTDIALATSGTAERGAHILDPATGAPADSPLLSLTVTGSSIITCDVLATAGFAMGSVARDWFAARQVRAFAVVADGSTWSTFDVGDQPTSGSGAGSTRVTLANPAPGTNL